MQNHEDAAKRAVSRLSLPDTFGMAPKLGWATSDMIWRAIGDTSTDGNFYSKRTILLAVFTSSLMAWLSDESAGKDKARAFLDARIENVMQFETFKWKMKNKTKDMPNPAEILGKFRYDKPFKRRRRQASYYR